MRQTQVYFWDCRRNRRTQAVLPLRILPLFHQTPWFRALAALALIVGALVLYRARVGALARRNAILENEVQALERAEAAEREQAQLTSRLRENERMELIGRLAGGVAHDFNNVLTVIIGHAEQLDWAKDWKEVREHADGILQCGDRAAKLTQQLLAFGGQQRMELQVLEPDAVVRGLEPMLRRVLPDRVELIRADGAPGSHVRADPNQLERVVTNLVLNASDAMPDGGSIRIETATTVGQVPDLGAGSDAELRPHYLLKVTDTGKGIAEDDLPRVFDPFFTTKSDSKGTVGGTGMGLASVKGIITQSGGQVQVRSRPGEGATFEVLLPLTSDLPEMNRAADSVKRQASASGTALVCEDYEPILRIVSHRLRQAGYSVRATTDPRDALNEIDLKEDLELLVVDYDLPHMSGTKLARQLLERHSKASVIVMSGHPRESQDFADTEGAWRFLQKPFSAPQLLKMVDELQAIRGRA